jgi:hypothetical protein
MTPIDGSRRTLLLATSEPGVREGRRGCEVIVVGIEFRSRGDDLVDAVKQFIIQNDVGPGEEVVKLLGCPRSDND